MTPLEAAFQKIRERRWVQFPFLDAAERYVATGDRAELARVTPYTGSDSYLLGPLVQALARPPAWTEADRRALHVLGAARLLGFVGTWLNDALAAEREGEDLHALVRAELKVAKVDDADILPYTALVSRLAEGSRPTSAGKFLLAQEDRVLRDVIVAMTGEISAAEAIENLLSLVLDAAPDRASALLPAFLDPEGWRLPQLCALLLQRAGARHEQDVVKTFWSLDHTHTRFLVGVELDRFAADRYGRAVLEAARASLARPSDSNHHPAVAEWMLRRFPKETLPELTAYVASRAGDGFYERQVTAAAVKALGREALPVALAAAQHASVETRLAALGHLLDLGANRDTVLSGIARGLEEPEAGAVVRFLALAARVEVAALAERIWPLLDHKSKPVRDAAARKLGRLGDDAVAPAVKRLDAKKGAARLAAVGVLAAAATPSALAALEARLDAEEDEDVRDAILRALDAAWKAAGRTFTDADVEARIARAAPRLGAPPAKWIEEPRLPPLRTADGRVLGEREVRYLLFRQSRAKEMAPDVEAAPLLARLHGAGGDFALELVRQYLASGADAADRWALALAGFAGDARVVPVLARQVREWADGGRGKLAEYAVQALALLGSDEALLAVDALALRYRTKNKNVGKAAVEAFAAAAQAQGVTPEELGDRVVPWLGFPPDGPRVVEAGAKRIEVRIGLDLKLALRDASTGKRVTSMPKSAPEEVRSELKDVTANLKEAAKAQALRLEHLMVRQRRWPADAWAAVFLRHPLLVPFAVRLVWAAYDAGGRRTATFRALEDRSLTDAADAAVPVPAAGTVGIVHPLELSEAERQAWRQHLADAEAEPPFPQLDRPVVHVDPGARGTRVDGALRGTSMNALTFKGRAERLGWQRGSVCDGGGISTYWRSFPAAGADAFLELDGMYIGVDMSASIELGALRFVRGGSVSVGSYTYDEPTSDDDPRVLPFGEVPPIVFSEVMGDLRRIAGGQAKNGGEGETAAA